MTRLVIKLPEGLAAKVAGASEEDDKLPTEWVRDLIRECFAAEEEAEVESEETDDEESA